MSKDRLHFWALCILFAIHQILVASKVYIGILDDYLDAFLIMPILLSLMAVENKFLFKTQRLHLLQIIVWTVVVAIVAEWLFPKLNPSFTADWIDVFMYCLGTIYYLVFFYFRKKTNTTNTSSINQNV